ncbi:MAG: radical SAM protein [Oscillospiraceae bacterium]|nr:radical SAM protein [Oscillospiraceae bacterium]
MAFLMDMIHCELCPRRCRANRTLNTEGMIKHGFCGAPAAVRIARAGLHFWEEPCISGPGAYADSTLPVGQVPAGTRGSGTVFFSHCNLGCCFCQNHKISAGGFGKNISVEHLAEIFLQLQEQGAYNLNLVTAAPYLPFVIQALEDVRGKLHIPVVYNTGGYELPEALDALAPYVDIWLTDLKFCDPSLAKELCGAADYFPIALAAAKKMVQLCGAPQYTADGLLRRGVIIRHLALPGHREDSKAVLNALAEHFDPHSFILSLMSQYTPCYKAKEIPPLHRRISSFEYNAVVAHALSLGLDTGYMQQRSSAKEEYTPPFDLSGV